MKRFLCLMGMLLPFLKLKAQSSKTKAPTRKSPLLGLKLTAYNVQLKNYLKAISLVAILFSGLKGHAQQALSGKVTSAVDGKGIPGAAVKVKGSRVGATTDAEGRFSLLPPAERGTLVIISMGFKAQEVAFEAGQQAPFLILLEPGDNTLDEVQIIGYGETTRRLNTGSVSTITAKEIEQQPVTNMLSALSGRMPGVYVQTTNGLPGGNINIQIRGTGSIAAGTNPLYIIDGVPFDGNPINDDHALSVNNVAGSLSPLNTLNPEDIESVTVLKDADATSIYGSRGSNGVVLITTKRGQQGTSRITVNTYQGFNSIANYPDLLNLDQYLELRREAFINDDISPSDDPTSLNYAPDLTVWSQTESSDWPRFVFGNTASVTQFQTGVSSGNQNTSFYLNANYRNEGTILNGEGNYRRTGLHSSISHRSEDQKFSIQFTGNYNSDDNEHSNLLNGAYGAMFFAPNYPLLNPDGSYNWYVGGNPIAELHARSKTSTDNLVGNIQLGYTIIPDLHLKLSTGFTKMTVGQIQTSPTISLNEWVYEDNFTQFGNNGNESFIVEPQIDYHWANGNSNFDLMLGGTYQIRTTERSFIIASAFSTESLMENLASAGRIDNRSNEFTEYRYASVFGRVTYNLSEKYIVNGTLRRDGSSRFGHNNRFGTFGSVGVAWLFGSEKWVVENFSAISFGKLRTSYGTIGNDQINDYQYLSTYSTPGGVNTYQGISILRPNRIANADFRWETTKKLETAIELGLIDDRVLLNISYYRNRSNSQLVSYRLPNMTGFNSYQANLPAEIENSGWELDINTKNLMKKEFRWSTSLNITLPKNRLLSFENIETSSYANALRIGEDITRIYGYQMIGLDPETGLAQYTDSDGNSSNNPYFFHTLGKQTPDFFGGIGNTFSFKGFNLEVFGQFAKQTGWGGLGTFTMMNYPMNGNAILLNRWTSSEDQTTIPRATTIMDSRYERSSANIFNSTYFRLKNVSLSYNLSGQTVRFFKAESIRIYSNLQNILTFWDRDNTMLDPESGATLISSTVPPLKSLVFGVQFMF